MFDSKLLEKCAHLFSPDASPAETDLGPFHADQVKAGTKVTILQA